MFRSFSYSMLGYAVSAAIFLVFSILFVRAYGADTYGEFSLLLSTVSALTMFGNYHGALVAFSPAVERRAFMATLRSVIVYAVGAGLVSAVALSAIGNLRSSLFVPAAIAFVFIVASGLPTSAVLASQANWMVNVARAVYQSLLILAFWALFAFQTELGSAFVLALLLASATYLALLARRVELPETPPAADPAPRGILLLAMCWNLAHMAIMLTDKFAIRYLAVGNDAADVGVYLLYLDIAGRFSAIYVIGMAPLTYELLRRIREGGRVHVPASIALSVCLLIGAAVAVVGEYVIPPLYATDLAGKAWLPTIIGVYLTLLGFGSVLLAYCNSAGRVRFLVWHYIGVFLTGAVVLIGLYIANGGHISVTQLAIALTVGQCYIFVSAGVLALRDKGGARSPRPSPRGEAAGAAMPGKAR